MSEKLCRMIAYRKLPQKPYSSAGCRCRVKGTDQIIDSGRVGACDSFTLTDHTTAAMHEHAVDITRLVWLGCSAWL